MSIRTLTRCVVAATASAGLFLPVPAASANVLPNGLDVTCTVIKDSTASCLIAGCPRVHGDYVVDAVHIIAYTYQVEKEFKCINGGKATYTTTFKDFGPHTIHVQACRKKDFEGDWCGPWSDYTFNQPKDAPPPPQDVPDQPPAKQAAPPVTCPAGSPTPTVPAGQTCAPVPDVTNAIQASFGDPTLSKLAFNVTNTSSITASCNYTATADTINPLVPKTTTRQFTVPANGSHTETFTGAPTLTTYNVVLSCKDASGKQQAELGHVTTSVRW